MQQLIEFLANHWILSSALVAVLLLMVLNELWTAWSGDKPLPPTEAVRLINDKNALLIDVRSPADFKKGHILNAVNVPTGRLEERAAELAKTKPAAVICYCAMGTAAPQATTRLRKLGFAAVYSLKGGLNAWQAASLPITTK
jgi:rhodanese-related sulfurtransferase